MSPKALKTLVITLAVIIVALLGVLIFVKPVEGPTQPVIGTSPVVSVVSSDGHLAVPTLHANDLVSDPLTLSGAVTGGGWFFEGSFPVQLFDGSGALIGTSPAQAQGDWTSTGTVPFTVSITYPPTTSTVGTILFQNDNPSGLPQNAKTVSVPIRFK